MEVRPIDGTWSKFVWNLSESESLARKFRDGKACLIDLRLAVEAQPTLTPPNESLTFEERREMDGRPVWLDDEKTWGILQVWDDNNVDAVFLRPRGCIRVKSVIGKKIYRRPPEGEA